MRARRSQSSQSCTRLGRVRVRVRVRVRARVRARARVRSLARAAQAVLEQSGQLRVPIWNVAAALALVGERIDAVGQGEQGAVDVGTW